MTQTWPCANGCPTPLTTADNRSGLISVNVDGHAKPAHRTCPQPLPCCNYLEREDRPCEGTMAPGWPEYVCDYCKARCGALAHPEHAA